MIKQKIWTLALPLMFFAVLGLTGHTASAAMSAAEFIQLCANSAPQAVKTALEGGADVKAQDDKGMTPLMAAAKGNINPEMIGVLVQAGAEVNARDKEGMTALMWAAANNKSPAIITALVNAKADVNLADEKDMTALMWAVEKDNPEVIDILVQAGAEVGVRGNNGVTALTLAAKNRNAQMQKALVKTQYRASTGNKDGKGMGAVDFIKLCMEGTPQAVQAALDGGADANAWNDNVEDVENKMAVGLTALMAAAAKSGNPAEVINILLKAGAHVNVWDGFGRTALMFAAAQSENPEVINSLLKAGADVKARDIGGNTVLIMAAAKNDNPEVINILIKSGAEVNVQPVRALMLAK